MVVWYLVIKLGYGMTVLPEPMKEEACLLAKSNIENPLNHVFCINKITGEVHK